MLRCAVQRNKPPTAAATLVTLRELLGGSLAEWGLVEGGAQRGLCL